MLTAQQVEDRAAQKRARRVVRHFNAGLIEVLYDDGGFEVWMSEDARSGFQMIRASKPAVAS